MPQVNIDMGFLAPAFLTIGLFIGAVIGFLSFNKAAQIALRKRIESGVYNTRPIDWISESRRAERIPATETVILVSIKAPVYDSRGNKAVSEEVVFPAELLDISSIGISVLSNTFIRPGTDVMIACNERKFAFPYTQAKVRYVKFADQGLRVGMEFLRPWSAAN